ncbi:MAG: sulfatase-like hydrolase/transferase [Thermoplasmata archaeon]|nr:sulfatase-like hydrolase/transferase [Thermoplasmata archaeon]
MNATAATPPRTDDPGGTSSRGSSPVAARPPNVLFVIWDCARAKSIGLSGGERVAHTPTLDRLAHEGTWFPRAVAPSNWTVPSHMSFLTGVYPNVHGVRTFQRGRPPLETIAAWMHRRQYETALFTEMVHLVGGYGLEEGFDHRAGRRLGISDEERTMTNRLVGHANVLYSARVRRLVERLPPLIVPMNAANHPQEVAFKREVCGDAMVDEFGGWLSQRSPSRPFFSVFNFVDAHEPYPTVDNGRRVGPLARWYARTPRFFLLAVDGLQRLVPWESLLDGYHASIEVADRKLGRLLGLLEQSGERDRTMVIVTADHGQSFGEGQNVYHGCGATDSITRVPLVVAPPPELPVPAVVQSWTSLCALPSWIKAAATGRSPYDDTGRAPVPFGVSAPAGPIVYCEGAPASDPNRSLRGVRSQELWNHRLLAGYRDDQKVILDTRTGRLYEWRGPEDPDHRAPRVWEPTEGAALRAEFFGAYETTGTKPASSVAGRETMPTEISRRLRSWGYD